MKRKLENDNLKILKNGINNRQSLKFLMSNDTAISEFKKLFDILYDIIIDNRIDLGMNRLINGVDFIYSSILIDPTAEQIKCDISDGSLTVNPDNILIYMQPNGDYYAYNLYNDAPECGEEFEKSMGWV